MLLAVNIGNSNIRLGVFEPSGKINSWTIAAKPIPSHQIFQEKYLESYSLHGVEIGAITKIVVGSVVPNLNEMIINVLRKVHEIEPLLVDRDSKAKIQHTSNQMGTDLFANAVAAHEFYEGKKIVVDFGTALTFTGIDEKGKTIGVSIAPGVITSLNSLVNSTAQLPQIEIKQPPNILGFDTLSCMQSGMVYGFLSMVEGMIDRINNELQEECFVIATGGMSYVYAPLSQKIHKQDVFHTIKGLAVLYELNK